MALSKEILSKLRFNIIFGFTSSSITTTLWTIAENWNWYIVFIFGTFLFVLMTFYGDEEYNITLYWSDRLKKIKNVIGNIVGGIFLIGGIICILMILSLSDHSHCR